MITKNQLRNAMIFVPLKGADFTVKDADGATLFVQGLTAGRYQGSDLALFMGPNDVASVPSSVAVLVRGQRLRRQRSDGADDMGANADWRPERMSDFEKEMRAKMRKLQARSDVAERMLKAAQKNKDNDVTEDVVEVIEENPAPPAVEAPEPAKEPGAKAE